MILIEVAHPAGTLTQADRELLAERVLGVLLNPDHAAEETMRRARTMTHIAFRELHDWHTGDGPSGVGDAAAPLVVHVTVPEAWRDETSRHAIGVVRAAVRRVDASRGWVRRPGSLWVIVHGVPDGSIGLDGKASTAADVVDALTAEYRAARAAGTAAPEPHGALVDPVCGMLVRPGKGTITLEHDGATVRFCAAGCRDIWAREHSGAARS